MVKSEQVLPMREYLGNYNSHNLNALEMMDYY